MQYTIKIEKSLIKRIEELGSYLTLKEIGNSNPKVVREDPTYIALRRSVVDLPDEFGEKISCAIKIKIKKFMRNYAR